MRLHLIYLLSTIKPILSFSQFSLKSFGPTCFWSASSSLPSPRSLQINAHNGNIQWDLFNRYHAPGSWKGIWTTYNYLGEIIDETVASVDYESNRNNSEEDEKESIQQTHTITIGAKRADCQTWMRTKESFDTKSIKVATYTPQQLHKSRLLSKCMVNGPSLLRRSGNLSTELVLAYGDGRVRVVFQHAPVVDNNTPTPLHLKLVRVMVSREALRSSPPTEQTESENVPSVGNPVFSRKVSPLQWHKVWRGSTSTWNPDVGEGDLIAVEMNEVDAWHTRPSGDAENNIWSMRLNGGILVQAPRAFQVDIGDNDDGAGMCRLAWLPTDDELMRVEANVLALKPMRSKDGSVEGFYPPSLGGLRCDIMKAIKESDNVSRIVQQDEEEVVLPRDDNDKR